MKRILTAPSVRLIDSGGREDTRYASMCLIGLAPQAKADAPLHGLWSWAAQIFDEVSGKLANHGVSVVQDGKIIGVGANAQIPAGASDRAFAGAATRADSPEERYIVMRTAQPSRNCMPQGSRISHHDLRKMLLNAAFMAASVIFAPAIAATTTVEPHIFAPGVITTAEADLAPTFVHNGRVLFFTRAADGGQWSVMRSDRRGRSWSPPVTASFSGQWNDGEVSAAPNGHYLIFASDRPGPGEKIRLTAHYYGRNQGGGALWRVNLTGVAAGALHRLPISVNAGGSVWTPSIAANDDLVFMRTDVASGRFRIFLAKSNGKGGYASVRPLAFSSGAANDVDPTLDPAERFLVFSSDRDTPGHGAYPGPEHLFIALSPLSARPVVCPLHLPGWSDPKADPKAKEIEPRLSLDETHLYFDSRHSDHAPGAPPSGAWDDDKMHIWVVRFSRELWQVGKGPVACSSAHLAGVEPRLATAGRHRRRHRRYGSRGAPSALERQASSSAESSGTVLPWAALALIWPRAKHSHASSKASESASAS